MSNQLKEEYEIPSQPTGGQEIRQGNLDDIRPVPRITVQAFCETDIVAQTIEMTGKDRRMSRTQLKVLMGGIPSAVDYYGTAPTPNLIIIESKLGSEELLAGLVYFFSFLGQYLDQVQKNLYLDQDQILRSVHIL